MKKAWLWSSTLQTVPYGTLAVVSSVRFNSVISRKIQCVNCWIYTYVGVGNPVTASDEKLLVEKDFDWKMMLRLFTMYFVLDDSAKLQTDLALLALFWWDFGEPKLSLVSSPRKPLMLLESSQWLADLSDPCCLRKLAIWGIWAHWQPLPKTLALLLPAT